VIGPFFTIAISQSRLKLKLLRKDVHWASWQRHVRVTAALCWRSFTVGYTHTHTHTI